ncbi:hypothetical protein LSM04_009767 [Trypanosoma melophagium]|uniref:uncharacterized protein n=1 Tax=Trypanosoma melophagium TaxID=715481 RepID=UPI00351A893C|nr:hypothetical protein LSM04_009767 [Trypanosoma melophagium]
MTESVSSGVTSFEVDDTFHFIDTETGNTWTRQRDGELGEVLKVPQSEGQPTLNVDDVREAVDASQCTIVETPMSAGTRSSWSLAGDSCCQRSQLREDKLRHISSSAASITNEIPCVSPASVIYAADSLSPSYVEVPHEEYLKESGEPFSSLGASAPEENEMPVSTVQPLQPDCNSEARERVTVQEVALPESILEEVLTESVGARENESNSNKNPTLDDCMFVQNAILRSQLAEADRNNAQYLLLQEKTAEELSAVRKTMMALVYGDVENNNYSNEGSFLQNLLGEQRWWGRALNILGAAQDVAPILPRRHLRRYSRGFSGIEIFSQDNYTSVEWRRNFASAKWHARHARAEMAMEMLLLAITSEDFDQWHSLLVEDQEWNHLRGVERQQWDSLVAAKVTELLRRGSDENVRREQREQQQQQQQQSEEGENLCTRRRASLQPELLVPFIQRISSRYAMEKMQHEAMVQSVIDTGTLSQEEVPSRSHNFFGTEIEDLLIASLSNFPENVDLLYLMASFRGLQSRTEDSIELLKHVLSIDPSYLLHPFSSMHHRNQHHHRHRHHQ